MLATRDETTAAESVPRGARDGAVPERVGRYTIEGVLGRGGMATVYLARDPALLRSVALKLIEGERDAGRLLREGQAIAAVSHPNVIAVYEAGREDDRVYIAMERIDGVTLAEWAREPRTVRAILDVFLAAGRGLAAAHAAGIVHRDFKPENVMVGRDGRVRVLDFGLARPDEGGAPDGPTSGALVATATGAIVGTPAYMSPEQWRGERPGPEGDQFSFCVSLARTLTGEHPFDTSTRERLRASVLGEAPSLAGIGGALRTAIARGLALDPAARHASMTALLEAIAPRSHARVAVATGAFGALAAGALAIVLARGDDAPSVVTYRAPVNLTSRGDVGIASVSPDGTQLAVVARDELLVRPIAGDAEPRVLLRGAFAYFTLPWSPDGKTLGVVAAVAGDPSPPGFGLVDVATGTFRRLGDNLGFVALLGGDELAAVRFRDRAVAVFSTSDTRTPTRTCALPEPFTGVRSLRYEATTDALLVQLDQSDSASGIVRLDRRTCRVLGAAAPPLPALQFATRIPDGVLLAHRFGTDDLVELDRAGAPGRSHRIQSADFEPIAIAPSGAVIHLDRFTHWRLASVTRDDRVTEVLAGTTAARFVLAPDGVTLAQVDGRGRLRVGPIDALVPRATGVTRVAWSPDGRALAVLERDGAAYVVSTLELATGARSARHPVAIAYDAGEMTWLDVRRVAFARPHDYRGFVWVEPATGATGILEVGGGEQTMAIARARRSPRLAFATETAHELHVWLVEDRHLATIPVTTPRSARKVRVAWGPDDASVIAFDGLSGQRWSVAVADGAVTPLAPIALPRDGFAELTNVFALDAERTLVEIVTRNADVFASRRSEP